MTRSSDEVLLDVAELQQAKNADYGDSWQKTATLKRELAGGELPHIETDHEAVMDGLYTRMLDKLARGYQLAFMADERDVDDETLVDTFEDLAGYAAMAAAAVEDDASAAVETRTVPVATCVGINCQNPVPTHGDVCHQCAPRY